jgi:hypothetical protein
MGSDKHKPKKAVWRFRGTDGVWHDLSTDPPRIEIPPYEWNPVLYEREGIQILKFNMN